jgi:spermidine/putrescine transport system ATP-binding protein
MRNELRGIQKRVGITFIYITHDQGEALTMSDRIAVMNEGRIEQVGDGKTIYDEPRTAFVASFVGENNPFAGKVVKTADSSAVVETTFGKLRGRNPSRLGVGSKAILFVRPEALKLGKGPADATLETSVRNVAFEGNASHLFLAGSGRRDITLTVSRRERAAVPAQGSKVTVSFEPESGVVLPEGKLARE